MEVDILQYVFNTFPENQHASGFVQSITNYLTRVQKAEDVTFDMSKREWKELEEKLK